VHEIRTDELALRFGKSPMRRECLLHLLRSLFEGRQQISMATFEVFENFGKLLLCRIDVEAEDTIHDMVGPSLVR
jgi:hypothetical protein